jgi:BirA family biotin operon repressor/biotin-[acetyl-CoA-carboxylase] ligase
MIGKRVLFLHEVDSTNNYAAKLLAAGNLTHGTVILAERQTAGRGQRGNKWESQAGKQFIATVYLETAFLSVERIVSFNMAFSLAVRATIQQFIQEPVFIKWPNDLMIQDKKNAGILIETQFKSGGLAGAICGVGINLFQEVGLESSIGWSQMLQVVPEPMTVLDMFCKQINAFYELLKQGQDAAIQAMFLEQLWMLNHEIAVTLNDGSEVNGKISGVSPNGDLLFQMANELKSFGIKEIHFHY